MKIDDGRAETRDAAFWVAFVPGVSPDTWFRRWAERSDIPIRSVPLEDDVRAPAELLAPREPNGTDEPVPPWADVALVRLPVEREGLHLIPLYTEQPVVVAAKGHAIEAAEEVALADLAGEHLLQDPAAVPGWAEITEGTTGGTRAATPAMTPRTTIEVVASGAGIAVLPLTVARQFDRKDVVRRPLADVAETRIALVWREDVDGELAGRIETFIGVVRGRSARSTRTAEAVAAEKEAAVRRAAEKRAAARRAADEARDRRHQARKATRRKGSGKRR